MRPAIKVGLSTASVYPLRTEAAFEYAAQLGYDGVELMVWGESVSQDIDAVEKLAHRYRVPVLSVHAPCLLISQRVWGANPIPKLERSVRAAEQLGAQTVVVHPPFRWQRRYAEGFREQIAELEASSDVMVAVENMFPFRADRFFRAEQSLQRMRKRGGGPARRFRRSRPPTTRWTATMLTTPSTCRTPRRRTVTRWTWRGGWVRVWCICISATATGCRSTSIWFLGAARNPRSRFARCWPTATSPAT
ncbi:xylose isomerase-like TIM barrel family protein [Mycobacterium xenopi 3993]|nr:xylose isomerase-like TIM barrel family protein [Mycobacterium xenopi 3993]